MNAKLCKKLRRAAEQATVNLPLRRHLHLRGQLVNANESTRGLYRQLKREAKAL